MGMLKFLSKVRPLGLFAVAYSLLLPCLSGGELDPGVGDEAAARKAAIPEMEDSDAVVEIAVNEVKTISPAQSEYAGWPMAIRTSDGKLMVVYSGGRDYHVCPFGQIELMTSDDDGVSWSEPQVIVDTPLDDRGSAIIEATDGSLLVTYISSTAYQRHLKDTKHLAKVFGDDLDEHLRRWREADESTTAEEKRRIQGPYRGFSAIRSTDGGQTWSKPYPIPSFSPRGPNLLSNGDIVHFSGQENIGWVSHDAGLTWEPLGKQMIPSGEDHLVECADGTLVAQVRYKDRQPEGIQQYTIQLESSDGGRTWSEPRKVTDGYPPHLLRLRDDTLLMTYGSRTPPYGIRAKLSQDNGQSWSQEFVIYDQGASWDIGYPCSLQLPDGRIVTIWYEAPEGDYRAKLRQATWSIGG